MAQGTDNPMYYYEGHDYTEEAKKADADVLGALLKRKPTSLQSGESSSLEPLTPRRRVSVQRYCHQGRYSICIQFQLRGRKVSYDLEEEKQKKLQEKMKKKKVKWLKTGYLSSAIRFEDFLAPMSQDEGHAAKKEEEEEKKEEEEEEEGEGDTQPIDDDGESPKKPKKSTSGGKWTCKVCTYLNENASAEKCEMCDNPKEGEKEEKEKEEKPAKPVKQATEATKPTITATAEKATQESEKEKDEAEENAEPEMQEEEDIRYAVGDVTVPYAQIDSGKNAIIGIYSHPSPY